MLLIKKKNYENKDPYKAIHIVEKVLDFNKE